MQHGRERLRRMTRIAISAAIISICAILAIPLVPGVPLTLQTFGVVLCASVLMPTEAIGAVLIYLLLGAAGLPVFSAMRGGVSVLLGPTGGFLLGLLPLALFGSLAKKQSVRPVFLGVGLLCCHALGWIWLYHFGTYIPEGGWLAGVAGYYIKDFVTGYFACLLGKRVRNGMDAPAAP